jgi:hypothetical protein
MVSADSRFSISSRKRGDSANLSEGFEQKPLCAALDWEQLGWRRSQQAIEH